MPIPKPVFVRKSPLIQHKSLGSLQMDDFPTKGQFLELFHSVSERYKPLFDDLCKGGFVGKIADAHHVPRITFQVVCYRETDKLLGRPISPRLLQRLWIMRLFLDGEDESKLVKQFGDSPVHYSKNLILKSLTQRQFKFDINNMKSPVYYYLKLHNIGKIP